MESTPARISVARVHPDDVKDRQILVSLDGERIATLTYGRSSTREVAPGPHHLKADNTLFSKTLEVDLKPGEHARFQVLNRPGKGTFSLLSLLGVGPLFLTFERLPENAPGGTTAAP